MAKFLDRTGREWLVELDVLKIEEIESDHEVRLTNLETDPLLKCREDPTVIASMLLVICREQREQRGVTGSSLSAPLPSPPDPMFEAMTEGIVDFFPSGRRSHVREVLTQMEAMATKSDEIAVAKLSTIVSDPRVMAKMNQKADQVFDEELERLLG